MLTLALFATSDEDCHVSELLVIEISNVAIKYLSSMLGDDRLTTRQGVS